MANSEFSLLYTGLCLLMCLLKELVLKQAKSHWLHLFGFSPLCVFSNVSLNCQPEEIHSHTGCICLTFIRCVFLNASSNCLPEKRHSHIGCICLTFRHCVFSNDSSNCPPEKRHSHIGCILSLIHISEPTRRP